MGARGRKPQAECAAGHDLTDEKNVAVVKRKVGDKHYPERQCVPCRRRRSRIWWANNRGKGVTHGAVA